MRLVELGTFGLLVLFVAGMTLQNQGQLQAEKDEIKENQETMKLEARLAKLESNTKKYVIPHDQDLETNTVQATLDASTSFDAGRAAAVTRLFVDAPIYNKNKPICVKWEDGCDDRSNNGLFEELNCECAEYAEDQCGDRIYEKVASKKINYVDACEYIKLDHKGREDYVKEKLFGDSKLTPEQKVAWKSYQDDLTYSWEKVNGPVMENLEQFGESKNSALLKLTLSQGEYRFRCTVTDKYQYVTSLTKDVNVIAEPNNAPEVYIK